jgi:hypothetical protein
MALRETERSLRMYLLIVGGLSTLGGLDLALELPRLPAGFAAHFSSLVFVGLAFGVGYLVAGLRLHKELRRGASWIQAMLIFHLVAALVEAWHVVRLGFFDTVAGGEGVIIAAIAAAAFGVPVYLLVNVRWLAGEAKARAPLPAARVP